VRDAVRYSFVPKSAISSKPPSVTGNNYRRVLPEKTVVRQHHVDEDNLRVARGVIFGAFVGLIFWLAFLYFVFPA